MKLEEYMLLTEEDQYNCWLNSVPVATYRGSFTIKVLYQLDSFYIESTYLVSDPADSYSIAFADTALLTPYLNCIDIRAIIQVL
jgi:hypothetical protein